MPVPILRFKSCILEDDSEWIPTNLGSISSILRGGTLGKNDICENGEPCVLYGELYTKYGPIMNKIHSNTDKNEDTSVLSQKNDVLMPSSGETAWDMSTASCILMDNVLIGGDINIIRSDVDGRFLSFTLNGFNRRQVAKLAQGASVFHLYPNHLRNTKLYIPKKPEQVMIGSFLQLLEEKIALQRRKVELLKDFKRNMAREIFCHRLNVVNDGQYSKWSETTLGNCLDKIVGGGTPPRKVEAYWQGKIPWVTVKDFTTFNPNDTEEHITELGLKNSASNLVPPKTVITATRINLGVAVQYNVPVAINQDLKALFTNEYLLPEFLKHWFACNRKIIMNLGSGSTVMGIKLDELKNLSINRPSIEEQKIIINLLNTIDEKIKIDNNLLIEWQIAKGAFLQYMLI